MRIIYLIIVIGIFTTNNLVAQTLTVLDTSSKAPVAGATVVVIDALTGKVELQSLTDESGSISIAIKNAERFVSITAVGFKKAVTQLNQKDQVIYLSAGTKELKTVAIKATRSPFKFEGNIMTFDIAQVPNADYLSLNEIMEQLPFIQVTENNIKMMNENLEILIDNRPNSIYKDAMSLKLLPPHAIEKMEVVLTPTARTGGKALNITLRRDYFLGWNSTVSVSGSRLGISPQVSLSYWRKKFGFDVSLSGNHSILRGNSLSIVNYFNQQSELREDEVSKTLSNRVGTNLSTYYNITDKDAIDMQYSISPSSNNYNSSSNIVKRSPALYSFDVSEITRKNAAFSHTVSLNYTHKYKKAGNAFYLLNRYSNSSTEIEQSLYNSSNNMANLNYVISENNTNSSEGTVEVIEQRNSNKKIKYVIGSKLIFRNNGNNNSVYINNLITPTIVRMSQFVSSTYADADWTISKFTIHSGLRFDYNNSKFTSPSYSYQTFNNLTPTLSLTYNASKISSFMLTYVRRVIRPSFYYTDPATNPVNAYETRAGAQTLQNQINNDWGLQYYGNYKFASLGFNVNYSRNDGFLSTVSTLENSNIIKTTSANIDALESFTIGVSANFKLFKKINISHFSSYSLLSQQSGIYSNKRWSGYISDRANYQISKKNSVSINAVAYSPNVSLQGVEQSMAYLNWGVGYSHYFDWLKKYPTTISVSLSNPHLYNGLLSYYTVNAPDFSKRKDSEKSNSVIGLSIRMQFKGKQFASRSFSREKSIQNSDLSE